MVKCIDYAGCFARLLVCPQDKRTHGLKNFLSEF
jgi:hypothetical protein